MARPEKMEASFFRRELLQAWRAVLPEVSAEQSELLVELAGCFEEVLFEPSSKGSAFSWQELGMRLAQETGLFGELVWSLFEKAQGLVLGFPLEEIRRRLPLLTEATALLEKGVVAQQKAQEEALFVEESMGGFQAWAGVIAHDLNNFLTIIQVHLELIGLDAEERGAEKRETKEIERATEKAIEYTRRLLRLGQGRSSALERISSEGFISSWLEKVRRSLPEGIALETRLGHALPEIRADGVELGTALDFVVEKACEGMPEGGEIRLAACVLDPLPCLPVPSPRRFRGGLRITLEDSGQGLSRSEARRGFFPEGKKRGKKGEGMGLSLAYGIVQQHGGCLFLEAEEGVGRKATVILPRAEG